MFTNEPEQGPVECRICHSKTTRDLILSPCLCKGSMGCVHIRCLEQWLNVSSHNFCELCSYRFEVIQVRRYSMLQSVQIWICQDQGSLYKSIFFIVLSATNSVLLSWMWFLWVTKVPNTLIKGEKIGENNIPNQEVHVQDISKPKWMAVFVFLTLLMGFSIKSLFYDGYKTIKFQYHAWHRWWNETVNIQLVLDLENYKIKNKLEESQDISLKYSLEKGYTSNQNTEANYKIVDFPPEDNNVTKLQEIHKPTDLNTDSVSDYSNLNEIKITNGESEKPQDNHECNKQEKTIYSNDKITVIATPRDIQCGNYTKNRSTEDIPKVHKQSNTDLE